MKLELNKGEIKMKEFILTQPYASLEEMLNSGEVAVYKEELEQGNIEKYAIVSRIGNRYDLNGKKIESFSKNPYLKKKEDVAKNVKIETAETLSDEEEKIMEVKVMKYFEIEKLIDAEIEKAVAELNAKYEQELATLKEAHANELASAKEKVKAELLAKLNS